MTGSAEVVVEHPAEGVAVVTFSDPARRNHLSMEGADRLTATVAAEREAGTRVIVLASGHAEHWIQHMWLPDLIGVVDRELSEWSGNPMSVFALADELARPEIVSIAAVDGHTAGGGCELGWACDLRVVGEGATFAQPEIRLDLTPGLGGVSRLMRLIGPTATAAMVLDGRPVTADHVHSLGAINRLVPAGRATEVAADWAAHIASASSPALTATKRILREAEDLHLTEAMANEQRHFQSVLEAALPAMLEAQRRLDGGQSAATIYGRPPEER